MLRADGKLIRCVVGTDTGRYVGLPTLTSFSVKLLKMIFFFKTESQNIEKTSFTGPYNL